MAEFEKAIPIILKHEGGFVNHPSDPGGATNRGIIFNLFKQYAQVLKVPTTLESLKSLTEDQAKFIYREHFWNEMKGDHINDQQLANIIFDGFVNMGYTALRILQREIGVSADGIFGEKTIFNLNYADPETVFNGFKDARIRYYEALAERKPQMKVFLNGWLNRINSFNYKK